MKNVNIENSLEWLQSQIQNYTLSKEDKEIITSYMINNGYTKIIRYFSTVKELKNSNADYKNCFVIRSTGILELK